MKFFSLISKEDIHEEPGKKVVPAKAFSSLKKAGDILSKAKREAIAFKKKMVEEAEKQRELSAKDGFEEGLKEFNEKILELDHELKVFREELNKNVLSLSVNAAKKILGEELQIHPERIVEIVSQALRPVTEHRKIRIYVNKEDLDILEENKPKIKKLLQQVDLFSIQERSDIEPGGCIIETEAGIINAQLENQWVALERAFEAYMKK